MSDTPKFTKGPWEAESEILYLGAHVSGRTPRVFKRGKGIGFTVAKIGRRAEKGPCPEAEANAALIAAAPDLLAALKEARSALMRVQGAFAGDTSKVTAGQRIDVMQAVMAAHDDARAAIAKAEGRS